MTDKKQNGYVTWPAFVTVLGLILGGLLALNTFVWSQHANLIGQFEKRMDSQFSSVEKRLDRIDRKLESRLP